MSGSEDSQRQSEHINIGLISKIKGSFETVFLVLKSIFSKLKKDKKSDFNEIVQRYPHLFKAEFGVLFRNLGKFKETIVVDVMIPRADICGVDINIGIHELIEVFNESGHSRLPVFKDNLDHIIGMVHVKDVLLQKQKNDNFRLKSIMRDVNFISPTMRALDLLMQMRGAKKHMSIIVDEFGGTDGLITIEDLVEEIVGEISDEHDHQEIPQITKVSEFIYKVDARYPLEDLETQVGEFLTEEEKENIDTVGGLVFSISGSVPVKGEILQHQTGVEFEVMDADQRKIGKVKLNLKNLDMEKIAT